MSKQSIIILAIVVVLLGLGVWGLIRSKDSTQEVSSTTTQNTNQNTNTNSNINSSTMNDQIDIKNKFVTLKVKDYGDIKVQLYDQDAPKTVENFLRLTRAHYYDGITFHRIAKDFVIQGGDPTGTGSGGESAFGGEFADELNPDTPSYKAGYAKGVLAMANRGPNTNTSQFFIMLGDVPLPHNYTIFGKVVSGQEVVDKIGQAEIIPQLGPTDGTPKNKIIIESATISDN